mgnify:CR=1 FL=1
MKYLVFEASRTGYGIDQVESPMTVGELREFLKDFEEDDEIILSHDRGYTYGTLSREASLRIETDGDYGAEYVEVDVISTGW